MPKKTLLAAASGLAIALCLIAWFTDVLHATREQTPPAEQVSLEHGRYLVQVGGCNDCHTAGYTQREGNVPTSEWLSGDRLGWRGPWGTTYPANLRLLLPKFGEDEWLAYARAMKPRPPMPWFNLRAMSDADLRSIYRFVIALGPAGVAAPAYVPPNTEPVAPFVRFP